MAAPVTVSVTRHVDPSRSSEMLAWVQAGTSLAEKFDGFLGSGWVRPSEDSADWHMLYRFQDGETLAAWERSAERSWWVASAAGIAEEVRALPDALETRIASDGGSLSVGQRQRIAAVRVYGINFSSLRSAVIDERNFCSVARPRSIIGRAA